MHKMDTNTHTRARRSLHAPTARHKARQWLRQDVAHVYHIRQPFPACRPIGDIRSTAVPLPVAPSCCPACSPLRLIFHTSLHPSHCPSHRWECIQNRATTREPVVMSSCVSTPIEDSQTGEAIQRAPPGHGRDVEGADSTRLASKPTRT